VTRQNRPTDPEIIKKMRHINWKKYAASIEEWKPGSIIQIYLDCDKKVMGYGLNGAFLGILIFSLILHLNSVSGC
jgi:hypothetical protein